VAAFQTFLSGRIWTFGENDGRGGELKGFKWKIFMTLNTLGILLGTFGTLDSHPITGLALPLGMILLLPGTIPVVLYIGQLTRFFDFLGVYGDHFACALTATLVNFTVWIAIGRVFHFMRPQE
jgi:hypothetical protein